MSPLRKIFASLLIVGTITAGGVACGTDDTSKSSDTPKSSDDSDSAASIEAWCKKLEQAEKDLDESLTYDEETIATFEDLAKDAPGEIRDDVEFLASAANDLVALDEEDEEAVEAFQEKYPAEEVDGVSERLDAFAKDKCGLDFDAD